ncbi:MAG: methylenetetrahydrofolate reductase [Nitrososphaerota archaeon]|nr:methylenetetrahydrofolate reductase [Nitrososphaerota archaeon]
MRACDIVSSRNFLRIVELFPPGIPAPRLISETQKFDLSSKFERLVENITSLEPLADAFSLPELNNGDRIHLNSVAVAAELNRRTGNVVIPTLTLRDMNRQLLMGSIAFAIFAGMQNLQIVRGDPYDKEKKDNPKNVYDVKRVSDLAREIRNLESHLSVREKLCLIAPINLFKLGDSDYIEVIRHRERAGIDIFVAESLFEDVETHLNRVSKLRRHGISAPIIHNIFPLRSYEDALTCKNKFGWRISEEELRKLKVGGADYGIEQARKRYQGLLEKKEISQGACISTRGNIEIVRQITS